ncbi:hypothetical protein [Streptomyces sp. NPDC050548]|uniref:hypothetical protein n=1 Tax=Streptomyces sp. NPDC050548 TaxID=3365629 RepID=UPI0037919DB7
MVLSERRRSRVESSLSMLLSPEAEDRYRAIDEIQEEQLLAHSAHLVVLVVEADGEPTGDTALALESAAERMERRLPRGSVLTLVTGRRATVVVGGPRPPSDRTVRELAERFRHDFGRTARPGRTCAIGLSATVHGLESVVDAHRQAGRPAPRSARPRSCRCSTVWRPGPRSAPSPCCCASTSTS